MCAPRSLPLCTCTQWPATTHRCPGLCALLLLATTPLTHPPNHSCVAPQIRDRKKKRGAATDANVTPAGDITVRGARGGKGRDGESSAKRSKGGSKDENTTGGDGAAGGDEAMHPSWLAKQRLKDQAKVVNFQGSRVTFSDSDDDDDDE